MRRSLAVATVLLLALGLALFSGQASARRAIESEIARVLMTALPTPFSLEGVSLEMFPPRVTILRPRVKRAEKEIARADAVVASIALGPSMWEGEWLADVEIDAPVVELDVRDRWWEAWTVGGDGGPSAKLRTLAVRNGRLEVVLVDEKATVHLDEIVANARWRGIVTSRVDFDARARGSIRRAESDLAIEEIVIDGGFRDGRLRFDEMLVKAPGTVVELKGALGGEEIDASLEGGVTLEPIFTLIPEAGTVRGRGRVAAKLSGSWEAPVVSADVAVTSLQLDQVELSGETPVRVRGSSWELGPAKLGLFGGEVEAAARGRFEPKLPYRLEGRIRGWDPARFLAALDLEIPIRGALDGEASLGGNLLADEVEGRARFDLRAEERIAKGEATFAVSPARDFVDLAIRPHDRGEIRARDEITGDRHSGEIRVQALELASLGPFLGYSLSGVAEGQATVAGSRSLPRLEGKGEIDALEIAQLAIGRLNGPFALSANGIESAALEAPDLGARASGRLSFSEESIGELRIALADADLERWSNLLRAHWPTVPRVSGRLSGEGTIGGPWVSPTVRAQVIANETMIENEAIGRLEASLERSASSSRLLARAGGWDGDEARVDLVVDENERLRGRAEVVRWDIAHVTALRRADPKAAGILRLNAEVRGTTERPSATGTIRIAEAAALGLSVGTIEGEIRTDERKATAALHAENRANASIDAELRPPYAYLLRGEWTDLEMSPAVTRVNRVTLSSSGRGELSGDVEQPVRRGMIRIDRLNVAHPSGRMTNPNPWNVGIADGTAVLDRGELEGSGQRLVLGGRASTSGYRISAEGDADLALAEGWVPGLVSSRGRVVLDVEGTGGFDEMPHLRGSARVEDGAADLGALVGLTDINGAFDLRDQNIAVRELVGAVGGGRFAIDGTVAGDGGYELRWRLQRASVGFPEWLDHRVSGEGTVVGPLVEPLVAGRIDVEQAIYDENVEWGEFLPWFRRQTRLPSARSSLPLRFDLRVVGDDGIFVDNNVAKIELAADLHLAGDVTRPTMGGRIEVLEGKVTFRERVFDLTSGDLRFDESRPFDPTMDVRGESRIRTPDDEIEIDLHVSGTAESPRVEFSADDPTLGQNDLLALVTFGRTMSQLQTGGAGVSLDELLSLTAGGRASRLGSGMQRVLPVDRIEIESAVSRSSGTTEPRVRIGKDLSATRLGDAVRGPLRASLGSSLGTGRERDVTVEYGLTRSISLEGLWESQTESGAGAFGADVKFRLPFWGSGFSLLPEWLRTSPRAPEPQ